MGSLYKLGRIRRYILIFFILVAAIISLPLRNHITRNVDERMNAVNQLILEKTGLIIKYDSLSPSILSSIYIRGITVFNADNEEILEISKAKVGFKILSLLKLDIQNGISNVVVDGISLDLAKLELLVKKLNFKFEEMEGTDFVSIQQYIPSNIKLKNVDFIYDKEPFYILMNVKSVALSNNAQKNILDVNFNSNLKASYNEFKRTITSNFNFNGTITPTLDNSQLSVKLSNLTDGTYKLNKLNLHAAYNQKVFDIHTIQAVNPLSISARYNIDSFQLDTQIKSQNLSPLSVFSINSKQNQLLKLKNMKIDTDTAFSMNFQDLENLQMEYASDTSILVPDQIFPKGFVVNFDVSGNEKKVKLSELNVNGDKISAQAALDFIFDKQQLSGNISISNFEMPNNKVISTEVFIDSMDTGFMAFSPQLFIGDKALTALQLTIMPQTDSYDFVFEAYDYSHSETADPGLFRIDGSYLLQSNYFQTNIAVNSIYIDSIAEYAAQFLQPEYSDTILKNTDSLAPYVISGDIYASTDLKSLSYNVPYILAANTQKDNQVLMLSLNGSNQNIQLDSLSLVYGKYALEASGSFDRALDSSDMFFTLDLNADSIPYHYSGSIMSEIISIQGDYNTDLEVRFGKNKNIDGHFNFKSLPVSLITNTVIFSTDSSFHYDTENGPELQVSNFEAELADSSVSVSPKLVFSGNMTKYGAQLESLAYTDLYSALVGNADLMININEGVFDSVGMMVNVKNPMSNESIIVDGNISNPYHLPLTTENLMKYIYLNMQFQVNSFSLNRFVYSQNEDNQITATLYTSGTIEHPYVSLNIEDSAILLSSEFMKINGSMVLEDRDFEVNDLNILFNGINLEHLDAKGSLTDMSLNARGKLNCNMMGKTVEAPLKLNVSNAIVTKGNLLPDSFMMTLSTEKVAGSLIKKSFPLTFNVLYSDKNFSLYSSDNAGTTGSMTTDGLFELTVDNRDFIAFKMDGQATSDSANIQLYDCDIDLKKLLNYINLDDLILLDSGKFAGALNISGNLDDPDFMGSFVVLQPEFKLPILSKQKISTDMMTLSFNHNEIALENSVLTAKNGAQTALDFRFYMNKWTMNHIEGSIKSVKRDLFPVYIETPMVKVEGDVSLDVQIYMEDTLLELKGKVFGENLDINSSLSSIGTLSFTNNEQESNAASEIQLKTDLNISLGTHTSINFDPLLRCVFVPNTSLNLKIDQDGGVYAVDGMLRLKSGDLAYLNRNFYIKEGSIKFNPDDITNPLVTLSAETREKDERNQTVKITLSVENQYLKNLNPKFTSTPAKSENEIRSLLGQIVVADSATATNFLFAASDYAIQSTVVRSVENKLRDLLNFDIFSLRTNVLQNTLNLGMSGNLSKENLTIGNFLDNSTVYIGKYLNSSIYVDAMLHVSLEDYGVTDIFAPGSLKFQPEFGLELETPFYTNIRVNMAPDINALLKNQFVPSASVTLSWKYAF